MESVECGDDAYLLGVLGRSYGENDAFTGFAVASMGLTRCHRQAIDVLREVIGLPKLKTRIEILIYVFSRGKIREDHFRGGINSHVSFETALIFQEVKMSISRKYQACPWPLPEWDAQRSLFSFMQLGFWRFWIHIFL